MLYLVPLIYCLFLYQPEKRVLQKPLLPVRVNHSSLFLFFCKNLGVGAGKFYNISEILPFATMWMELECIMLSEVSQSEKDKCHMIPLICGI